MENILIEKNVDKKDQVSLNSNGKGKRGNYIKNEFTFDKKIQREDLTEKGKKYVNDLCLRRKIVGLILPSIFALWGRFWRKTFFIIKIPYLILQLTVGSVSRGISEAIYLVFFIIFAVYIRLYGSENAFNNSEGYLKDMVIGNNISNDLIG